MSITKRILLAVLPICLFLIFPAEALFASDIKIIYIVPPAWENQINDDGTGFFFDIIRSVYEPAGIKMEYKFFPWKRAELLVESGKADAMLCMA